MQDLTSQFHVKAAQKSIVYLELPENFDFKL